MGQKQLYLCNILFILSCFAKSLIACENNLKQRPVIGILAQTELSSKRGDSYIMSAYVKFMEQAGALVIPIEIDKDEGYYADVFSMINGVVLPGGGVSLTSSGYANASGILYHLALKANDGGDFFPMLGICLGFEELATLAAGQNLMKDCRAEDITMALKLTKDANASRFFTSMPNDLRAAVQQWNITMNNHRECLTPYNYSHNTILKEMYRVTSTNYDQTGTEFVSTMEAYKYPFYATQWHPEKNLYHWTPGSNANHSELAVRLSQFVANFFIQEAHKSTHCYTSINALSDAIIFNYKPHYKWGLFEEIYIFNISQKIDEKWNLTPAWLTVRLQIHLAFTLLLLGCACILIATITTPRFPKQRPLLDDELPIKQHEEQKKQSYLNKHSRAYFSDQMVTHGD